MAILQISKLQQRSGNLVDLPQLDDAEFGWATDSGQLYIGKGSPAENIEVLTSYSNISFSQITDSGGNIFVSAGHNGQILGYDGTQWVNRGGTIGGLVDLGAVANVKLSGGAIGYVLETDGTGNLSWTSKGTLRVDILNLNNANPLVMTVANTTPYVNSMEVTISGVNGTGNSIVNGLNFFVELSVDFPTSGKVTLYTDALLVLPVDGSTMVYASPPSGVATTSLASGTVTAAGADKSVQYNQGSILQGSADLTFDYTTKWFTVNGNANVGNLSSHRLFSSVATGTTPITVNSTTRVANLNVSYANVSDYEVTTAQTTGTFYPTFVNGSTTANYELGSNTNLSFNAATGALSATLLTGTLTTAAQPNLTSTGTLTTLAVTGTVAAGNLTTSGVLSVTGNANVGNLGTTGLIVTTGNVTGGNLVTGGKLSVTGNANVGNLGATAGVFTGTLNVTGNANVGNLGTAGLVVATGNVTGGNLVTGGMLTVTGNANVGNLGTIGLILATGNISGGNVNAGNLLTANYLTGTLTTATQPNITSVGTLTLLTTAVITSGATATNGTITGNWALTAGSKLNATYADLAEYYEADATYVPGTVLMFGGDKEVTLASNATNKVAGVVSTNPAYLMNSRCPGAYTAAIALQGRAPCKVRGTIHKGDMLISDGDGFARACASPLMGTVIGKSLEDFDGVSGIIECAVGRL